MEILKTLNIGLAFVLELVMLAVYGYWGFQGEKSVWMKWILGIGAPLTVAVIWGLFLAPKAEYRLNITAGMALALVLYLLAAFALYQTGHPTLAIALASIIVIHQALLLLWRQW